MPSIEVALSDSLADEIERIVREGWYPSPEAVVEAALADFVERRTFLGDTPRLLLRFAADALEQSRPEVALRFIDRGLARLTEAELFDRALYQQMTELRVQLLLILGREPDALLTLEQAREKLPNSPGLMRWIERLAPGGQ